MRKSHYIRYRSFYKEVERESFLDIVRIFAVFLVLFTHTGLRGNKLYQITPNGFKQYFYLLLDCFRTINNPLLFMTSGALLLGKNEGVKTIWKKRIFRFLIVLILFSFIHIVYSQDIDINKFLLDLIQKPVKTSYWYLYSYISFLVTLPFLRKIAQTTSFQEACYLFGVTVVFSDGFNLFKHVTGVKSVNFSEFLISMNVIYPLIGYWCNKYWEELKRQFRWLLPGLILSSLVSLIFAVYMTKQTFLKTGYWGEEWITFGYSLTSLSFFVIVKFIVDKCDINYIISRILSFLSGTMFGIYLLENILKDYTEGCFFLFNHHMPTLLACVLWLFMSMVLGNIVIGLLKTIPFLKSIL